MDAQQVYDDKEFKAYCDSENMAVGSLYGIVAWKAWQAKAEQIEQLKKEIADMKAGIDPKWGLMDQSILVDYLRENTNFCAEKFDGMIQFAVDAANREYK